MTIHNYRSLISTLGTCITAKLLSFFKISIVIGSQWAMLSGVGMALPLIGLFGGALMSTLFFGVSIGLRYLFFGISSFSILAFYVPGWCASLYMTSSHWMIRLLLPALCMVLFVIHPVGNSAWLYAMYWLIPSAVYLSKRTHIFYQALGATFTAHAVGSVIWLYTVGMTADVWLGLIPIVACERLAYAAGMVVIYHAIKALSFYMTSTCTYIRTSYRASL